eukprot:scaffold296_cov164-Ochromonas_danica.AAC.24
MKNQSDLEEFTKLKFKQLEIAQSCTLLIYTRDRTDLALAKKLRPEFRRLLFSTELKDCQRSISRITNDNKEEAPVDIVLADFDLSIPKFIDYINKRPSQAETNLCPLIPVVILAKETSIKDVEDHLLPFGGVNKILDPPFKSHTVFNVLLEALYNRNKVEETFNYIKKVPTKAAKYPFLSIFEAKPPLKNKETEEITKNSILTGSTSLHAADHVVLDELDAASESSSMLPDCVKVARRKHPELNNQYESPELDEMQDNLGNGLSGGVKRPGTPPPASILKKQSSFGRQPSLSAFRQRSSKRFNFGDLQHVNQDEEEEEKAKVDKLVLPDEQWNSINMLDSQEARRGSLMLFSDDSLSNNNSHEGMSVSTTMDGETLKKKLATMGVQNEVLMDSVHRPVWKESKQAERQLRRTGGKVVHDFSHFLEKQPPALNKVRTVSGLDRKVCQQAWRAIKRPLTSSAIDLRSGKKVYSSLTHDVFFTLSVHHNDLIEKSGLPRLDTLRVVTEGSTPKGTPKSSSMKGSSERIITLRKDDSFLLQVTNNSTGKNTPTKAMMKSRADSIHSGISGEGDHISIVQEDDRSWLKKSGGGSDLSLSCFSQDPRNTSKYYRRIAQVAKQNIPDLQRLLSALKYYDQAIHIIESKPIGVRPRQHAFLAYYNRAIIYFRLGDDDDGIRDITTALEYNNEHLQAREILSLAKRRLGLYGQAIDEAIKHKNLKVDLHVKEIEKQRKAFEASQKLRMVKGNTTNNNNNDHDNNNNNYDDDDIVHPIGEIQHSSHLLQSAISRRGESMLSKGSNNGGGIKTMQIEVPESSCRSSLRDRVAAHRGSNNAFGAKDNDNNDDEERGNSTELADVHY